MTARIVKIQQRSFANNILNILRFDYSTLNKGMLCVTVAGMLKHSKKKKETI